MVDHMPEKVHQLEELRLARDWSYRELAEVIATETGFQRNQDCWRKICQGRTKNAHKPTLRALALFYSAVRNNGHRRRRAS